MAKVIITNKGVQIQRKRLTRLGKEIRKACIDQDLTQADLQALTGIDFRHLSAIERGDIDPRWSTVLKIAHALDLNLDVVACDSMREQQEADHDA